MRSARGSFDAPWTLVDPTLTSDLACRVPQALLDLAASDWNADVDLDIAGSQTFLRNHRVSTILRAHDVSDEHRAEHLERLLYINGTQLRIHATAKHALSLLHDRDIQTAVLKGLASAELDYPQPELRQMGDVDIAVRADDLAPTLQLLRANGYRDLAPALKSEYLTKGVTLRSPTGIEVDIHTRLFQRSAMSNILFEDTEALATLPSEAMSANLRLVHAAGHFILAPPGGRRLSGLIDITQILRRDNLDLEQARQLAAHLQVEPLVGAALRLEAQLSQRRDVLESLETWKQPGWFDRNTRLVAERRYLIDHFCRFREVQRGDRLRYLPAWLIPDQQQRRNFAASIRRKAAR